VDGVLVGCTASCTNLDARRWEFCLKAWVFFLPRLAPFSSGVFVSSVFGCILCCFQLCNFVLSGKLGAYREALLSFTLACSIR
jgi:hypothetical protein